jgi:hypothetical protein
MSMTQLIIGACLGFMIAQGVLHGIRQLSGWLQHDRVRTRVRALVPAPALISAFVRYAGPVGASAALITLGVWAVSDYLAAKSAHAAAMANLFDPAVSEAPTDPHNVAEVSAPPAAVPVVDAAPAAANGPDPYHDPDFKVQRPAHKAGTAPSLKETLLQRSEAKTRSELLRQLQQHAQRSQYDCEAADHGQKYLKADLDVWGFAAWQVKYFPPADYQGATLPQCRDLKNVLDPTLLDLHSTVAKQ